MALRLSVAHGETDATYRVQKVCSGPVVMRASRDVGRDVAGNHLHQDREAARLLHGQRITQDGIRAFAAAFGAVPAEGVFGLRGEADVCADRDTAVGEALDLGCPQVRSVTGWKGTDHQTEDVQVD